MGTTASLDVGGTRVRGDPERRFRLRLGALLVAGMVAAFAGGAATVLTDVRGELLSSAGRDAADSLAMVLGENPAGELEAPPVTDASTWNTLLADLGRSRAVHDILVWDASGTALLSLRGSLATAALRPDALRKALSGERTVTLGRPAGPGARAPFGAATLDVVLPVVLRGADGAPSRRGAIEVVSDGRPVLEAVRRVWIELGAISALLILALTALILHLANLMTARALRDPLTGVANLRHFETAAAGMLPRLARHGRSAAVVVVDLSRLGNVNDALGHRAGDALLRLAAKVLRSETRPGDVLARVGGQFLTLLDEADAEGAEAFAKRVLASLERSVHVGPGPVRLRATAGIAVFPDHGSTLDELRAHADSALREAKLGGFPFFAYRKGLGHSTAEALALESDLAAAIVQGELVAFGQPVVAMGSGEVAGVELLARWQHPERGLLAPGAFIPQAEEAGLIRELDRWAFDAAAAAVAVWAGQGFEGFVSVNLSAQSLTDRSLPEASRLALERHGAPPDRLVVEVTETAAIRDLQGSRNVLEALRELGLRIALDDFGTGYSSLAYLRRLPVDLIKIDRQFTEHVASQRSDQYLVRALMTYTRGLGLNVVAEGIETEAQHDWLEHAGIELGQGFLYGVPGPLDRPPVTLPVPGAPARRS